MGRIIRGDVVDSTDVLVPTNPEGDKKPESEEDKKKETEKK